jgi:hypothetical protein
MYVWYLLGRVTDNGKVNRGMSRNRTGDSRLQDEHSSARTPNGPGRTFDTLKSARFPSGSGSRD